MWIRERILIFVVPGAYFMCTIVYTLICSITSCSLCIGRVCSLNLLHHICLFFIALIYPHNTHDHMTSSTCTRHAYSPHMLHVNKASDHKQKNMTSSQENVTRTMRPTTAAETKTTSTAQVQDINDDASQSHSVRCEDMLCLVGLASVLVTLCVAPVQRMHRHCVEHINKEYMYHVLW